MFLSMKTTHMWLPNKVKFNFFLPAFFLRNYRPEASQDADTFRLMWQRVSLFLLCVNRYVDSTYCNGLLILQWKQNYSGLKNKQKEWFTLGVLDALNFKGHSLFNSLSAHSDHTDSRCHPGFSCPLASDHTSFKHHVHQPPSMSWPWPQHSSQEKPSSQHPHATFLQLHTLLFPPIYAPPPTPTLHSSLHSWYNFSN